MPDKDKDKTHDNMKNRYGMTPYESTDIPPSPYIRYVEHEPEEEVHLRNYLNIILKRKWTVILFLISVIVTTAVLTSMMVPLYSSTAVIKIAKERPNLSFEGVLGGSPGSDFYETQYEILKSRTLAEMVVEKLDLVGDKNFFTPQSKLTKIKNKITRPVERSIEKLFSFFAQKEVKDKPVAKAPVIQEEIPLYYSGSLISRLKVLPIKKSQLIKLTFESHDPGLSMNVANSVAEAYIQYGLLSRVGTSLETKMFLEDQITIVNHKMEESEKKLNQYASKKELVYFKGSNLSVLDKKLADLASAVNKATTMRLEKEALLQEIKESVTYSPVTLKNPILLELIKEKAQLETQYLDLLKTYTEDYPELQSVKSKIDSLSEKIEREKIVFIKSIESDYSAAIKEEENLKKEFAGLQKKVLDFQDNNSEYLELRREYDMNKDMHANLVQKLNQVGIAALSKSTNIQIVDKAVYPKKPSKPNKARNFLLSIVFGLFGGVGLAFLVEYFDNTTVKNVKDIERGVHLPSLGIIPHEKMLYTDKRPDIITNDQSSPVSEAFRSICTYITLSSSDNPIKTLLVTSPGEKEGKTTFCVNIASALTESLGDGIIIDADLRKPKLHDSFHVGNETGLSSYLEGLIEFEGSNGALMKPTSVKGLSIIPSGPIPPKPSQLLHSDRMKDLVDALYALYHFIIIDSPPIIGMPDSIFLSSMVDGTVLVVKSGETSKNALIETKKMFNNIHSRLLGVVLNDVKKSDLKHSYYAYHESSYYKK